METEHNKTILGYHSCQGGYIVKQTTSSKTTFILVIRKKDVGGS